MTALVDQRTRDLLNLDHLLSDEERMIRDTVRRFVAERVTPHAGDWFEEGRIHAIWPATSAPSAFSVCTSRATAQQARARPPRVRAGEERLAAAW